VEAVATEASRNQEESRERAAGNCPRCGVRMAQSFKYCPNCAYRLRPGLAPDAAPLPRRRTPLAERLIALGGYLAFASILLLVTLVGFRLFNRPPPAAPATPRIVRPRDPDRRALDADSFRRVESGLALYGLFDLRSYESGVTDAPPKVEEFHVDDPFELAVHEVTNDQYYEFLDAWADRADRPVPPWMYPEGWRTETGGRRVRYAYAARDADLPVTGVPFAAAVEFCAWFWESRLDRDPDRIVDLPTWLEYLRATRPGLEDNFPWGDTLRYDSPVNLSGRPRAVADPRVGKHGPFFGLVGNAAEWVHGDPPLAAGWSWQNREYVEAWQRSGQRPTPFGESGFRVVVDGRAEPDVGFRVLIRHAPAQPRFGPEVEAGPVHLGRTHPDLLPPVVEDGRPPPDEPAEGRVEPIREPLISFANADRAVTRRFRITRTAVTNRQYLAFLVDRGENAEPLLPESWQTLHPLRRREPFEPARFLGPFGPPGLIEYVYAPGTENQPVVDLSPEQARAYAAWLSRRQARTCRLPTVGEYVRAGRGASRRAYPWGHLPFDAGLFTAANDPGRPVSILGRLGPPAAGDVVGLVGNVAEYVTDGSRILLAGGFYRLPPRLCTLDTFLDPSWRTVSYRRRENGIHRPFAGPFVPRSYAGFRLVTVREFP